MNTIQINRFWGNVDVKSNTECWEWKRYKDKQGYGTLSINNKTKIAHRIAFSLFHDSLNMDCVIRHTCDNPPCCNPAHLLSGTAADNVADMVERGRTAKGQKNRNAKLTEGQVIEIIRSNLSGSFLAKTYSVSDSLISAIRKGKRWKYLRF